MFDSLHSSTNEMFEKYFCNKSSYYEKYGRFLVTPRKPSRATTKLKPALLFRKHEMEKKREYGDRVRSVEHGSFTPLVFSTFGGLGREATVFYSRLADLLSKKHSTPYTKMLSLMRCNISFSLLRSAILAIRAVELLYILSAPLPLLSCAWQRLN